MNLNNNWTETRQRFNAWWNRTKTDRPMMWVAARNENIANESIVNPSFDNPEEFHISVEKRIQHYRNFLRKHNFKAEAFRNFSMNLGAGSMALYLGSEPVFAWDTLWFKECVENGWAEFGDLEFNEDTFWWKKHLDLLRQSKNLSKGEFPITIPDIVENLDILASMRGTQNLLYDIMDEPDTIAKYLNQLDELYFKYYDAIYDIVKLEDNSSIYTAFQIWGPGKIAKIQCDFCAMLSPTLFKELVVPSLSKQCKRLDNSVYHLDGPDAVRHLDALLEIEELNAIQWTPGAGKPDGGSEEWYPIYDKVVNADKSLLISIYDGKFNDWMDKASRLVKRYDNKYLYMHFPVMSEEESSILLSTADSKWK